MDPTYSSISQYLSLFLSLEQLPQFDRLVLIFL